MTKKTWIKVKRGLLSPEHRQKLGARIWLYLHILDRADWDTGTIEGWTDKAHAEALDMPHRTLQDQRQRLADDGYIVCAQSFQALTLTINNWTNPRDYSGQVLNGTEKPVPQGTESSVPIQSESSVPLHKDHISSHIKESVKDRAVEPPPSKKRTKKRDIRLDHPAMKAYNEIARYWPPFAVRDQVCQVKDADKWRGVIREWIGKGWNPRNITGMLDVYKNGEKINGTRRPQQNAFLDALNAQGTEQ